MKTLQQINEYVFDKDVKWREQVKTLPLNQQKAFNTLHMLLDRKGFEWWWSDIAEDVQDEIFQELVKLVDGCECPARTNEMPGIDDS
ncbi:MAG: hypothetical protein K2Y22_04345 [Candidatus Obscuribacterales bacterium]|nr:hypothetical protein [Candidatus Obscuribacterales bacterium]